jgi:membrane-associated protease RseP (regulator of RpoE activity)
MPPEPPAVLLSVAPDTAAYRAGLRTGDRVLQVGETRPLTAATVRRLLARTADHPLLVIFERDAVQRAVWVKK